MAVWPFNHKKQQDTTLPEEVQEYYDAGKRQQKGMAWLLAFGTLLATILLATILFFGGRWIFQKITGNDDKPDQPTSQEIKEQEQVNQGQDEDKTSGDQQGSSSTTTTTPSPTPSSGSATPSTGSTVTEVPNTGPGPEGLQ